MLRCENLVRRTVKIINTTDNERLVLNTAVSNFTDNHRRLQGRNQLEALANGGIEGIPQVPILVVILFFIFFTGNEARRFTAHGDSRLFTHAEHFSIFGKLINAYSTSQFIEIDVIRLGQSFGEINPTQSFTAGISHVDEPMSTGVENHLIRCNFFQLQGSSPGNQLKGRPGRIFTGNNTIFHRMVGISVYLLPFRLRNSACKPVGVVCRPAGHGQNGPRIGIDGHSGNTADTDSLSDLSIHSLFQSRL